MIKKSDYLRKAKKVKYDEFYTQLTTIERELKWYKPFFKGKKVLCNCNDSVKSEFFRYFSLSFEHLGLSKLTCVAYNENGHGTKCVYNGDKNGNLMPDMDEVEVTELNGNGGFETDECVELLKECDVVVTNPPFSLFRDFLSLLIKYDKKFLIIGNLNSVICKDIFPLVKNNKLWFGVSKTSNGVYFRVPKDFEYGDTYKFDKICDGVNVARMQSIRWFTNIDNDNRHYPLDLYKKYNPTEFPKYDNYDAINVNKVCDIPLDYDGVMGVPITFLDKYCPTQFEIDGIMTGATGEYFVNGNDGKSKFRVNGDNVYSRILIKKLSL